MPKVIDHDRKRQAIAEATWRTIAKRGLDATTLREIADEAQCSTGVLAHYFADKDALLLHTLQAAIERTAARMEERCRNADGLAALRAVIHEALPLNEERRGEWHIWLGFWGRAINDAALTGQQTRWYALWRCAVQTLIQACQRDGVLRADLDTAREADALVALVDGLGIQALFEPERMSAREQIALLDGYLARLASTGS